MYPAAQVSSAGEPNGMPAEPARRTPQLACQARHHSCGLAHGQAARTIRPTPPGRLHRLPYRTPAPVARLKIGRYSEITIAPTTTPMKMIRMGSSSEVRLWTVVSTSTS